MERRRRRSQRLRAIATVLALSAAMLVISAIGLAAALVRGDGSDSEAQRTLADAARVAQTLEGLGQSVSTAALASELPKLSVNDATVPSHNAREVSVATSTGPNDISGWYGAVQSRSGKCLASAVIERQPQQLVVLPKNCTGDAARASLRPTSSASMVPTSPVPGAQAPSG